MNSLQDLDRSIDLWFEEDIREGDHTTLSTIPAEATGRAVLHVKQEGIIAGIAVAERVFNRFDPQVKMIAFMDDGNSISVGDKVFEVAGRVQTILQCERLVLNIMQRMSGIATSTREFVHLVEGTGTRILDTRKTTPGFRLLEKEAVRLGGGVNHRFGLFDMILIKDNHIDFAGGIEQAIRGTLQYLEKNKLNLQIVIEARNIRDVEEVLRIGNVNRMMLDNFTTRMTREAVTLIDGRLETESSGGITRDTIRDYAECGVDYISVGALTHQVKSLDLSLKADF
ncbi:MAG: carboxylating nicotinate-nucleotide diphosphorylase [Bacteroidales bacterium]